MAAGVLLRLDPGGRNGRFRELYFTDLKVTTNIATSWDTKGPRMVIWARSKPKCATLNVGKVAGSTCDQR